VVVLFQFAGTLGGWVIMRPLDRYGMWPCALLYLLSIPAVACLGLPGISETMLMLLCALAGFCVLGLHLTTLADPSSAFDHDEAGRLFGRQFLEVCELRLASKERGGGARRGCHSGELSGRSRRVHQIDKCHFGAPICT